MARFESGLTGAAGELLAGRLDASFGRFAGLEPAVRARLEQQPVRYEPMTVVLPEDHRLAALDAVPLEALAGETVYAGAGNPRTREWTDLACQLFAGRGIELAPPAPVAVGAEEFRRIMTKKRNPVLAVVDFPAMPGTVRRPLIDPVPLSPVSLVWRKGLTHPGIDALRRAAGELASEEGWLRRPAGGGSRPRTRSLWEWGRESTATSPSPPRSRESNVPFRSLTATDRKRVLPTFGTQPVVVRHLGTAPENRGGVMTAPSTAPAQSREAAGSRSGIRRTRPSGKRRVRRSPGGICSSPCSPSTSGSRSGPCGR